MTVGPLDKEEEMNWLKDDEVAGKGNHGFSICFSI